MSRIAILLLMAIISSLPAAAEIQTKKIQYGGLERSFRLYTPASLDRILGPRPLVLVLHGGGGSSREVRYSTRGRFETLADENGFFVLYPDAIGRIWDTGGGQMSEGLSPRRDDTGFLRAAIRSVVEAYPIDTARIFATGVSRGGMESYALGCRKPSPLRAIAPVAMPLPEASAEACATGVPLGFLLIHGTTDPFVPYEGGPINIGRRDRDTVLSAEATMALFVERNRCFSPVEETIGTVRHTDWWGCAVPTGFYSVGGGGHGWPGGRKVIPGGRAGPVNTDITAADEIWKFFSRF